MTPKRIVAALRLENGRLENSWRGRTATAAARDCLSAGADEIMLLDDSGTTARIEGLIRTTAEIRRGERNAPLSVVGNLSTLEDVARVMKAGATRAVFGTAAVANPQLVREATDRFGPDAISVLIDVRLERRRGEATVDVGADGTVLLETDTTAGWYRVYVRGGNTATARDALAWAQECAGLNAGELIVRAIEPAGETPHYDLELVGRLSEVVDVPVLAAGPPAPAELIREALTLSGASGVVLLEAAAMPREDLRRLHDELEAGGVALTPSAQ